jgi:hypothetical protein
MNIYLPKSNSCALAKTIEAKLFFAFFSKKNSCRKPETLGLAPKKRFENIELPYILVFKSHIYSINSI